ncbi:pentapeptide repeat-containing protein [Paractinoplanes maris]|uniref:pentapeptide repeat-containing protein n=1 Tax=Paractinoplanes maris TaxID=1734446 RepID=UPI0020208A42|nr:pentapeptide repeat-containing protein [Actinoplanes maris]
MSIEDLSETEQAVRKAFRTGRRLDLTRATDRVVRAGVLRFLLLGGFPAEGGQLPALRLTGAHVTGQIQLAYAEVQAVISLRDCRFDQRIDLYGAHLQVVTLHGCSFPGILASNATFAGSLRLVNCRCAGNLQLAGSTIANALFLDETTLTPPADENAGPAFDGTRLRVGADVVALSGFRCVGEFRLTNAEISGSLRWSGATLEHPDGVALSAADLRVGAIANLCDGFVADGSVALPYAQITSRLCFENAVLRGSGEMSVDLRHVQSRELVLLPAVAPPGAVDLRHARVGLLRDSPSTWARELRLDGLTYEALSDGGDRLDWLRRDSGEFRPQTYSQLAAAYRGAGRDDDAREVQLAGERHRRRTLRRPGRIWGLIQDYTVGYGYRPTRAVVWLAALLALGTIVFSAYPPRAAEAPKAPEFIAFAYAADLILPVVDLGQQSAYLARGATAWLAYFLILAGLLFATTITAAAARRLRRV